MALRIGSVGSCMEVGSIYYGGEGSRAPFIPCMDAWWCTQRLALQNLYTTSMHGMTASQQGAVGSANRYNGAGNLLERKLIVQLTTVGH